MLNRLANSVQERTRAKPGADHEAQPLARHERIR